MLKAPSIAALLRKKALVVETELVHKKGCLMVLIPEPFRKQITDWVLETIADFHLTGDGRELSPHVTILYGFPPDFSEEQFDELKALLTRQGPIELQLGGLAAFRGGKDGDPLYVEIESPQLHALNGMLSEVFGIASDYDEYVPHLTLAYLQPEAVELYLEELPDFLGQSMEANELEWGAADGYKEIIPLSFLPSFGVKKYQESKDKRGHRVCTDDGVRVECRGSGNTEAPVGNDQPKPEEAPQAIDSPVQAKEAVESQLAKVEENNVIDHEFTPEQIQAEQNWQNEFVDHAVANPKQKLQPKDIPAATRFLTGLLNGSLGGVKLAGGLLGKFMGLDEVFKEEIQAIRAIKDALDEAYPDGGKLNKMVAMLAGGIMGDAGLEIVKSVIEHKQGKKKEAEKTQLQSELEQAKADYEATDDPEEEEKLQNRIDEIKRKLQSEHDVEFDEDAEKASSPKAQRKEAFDRADNLQRAIDSEKDPQRKRQLERNLAEAKDVLKNRYGVKPEPEEESSADRAIEGKPAKKPENPVIPKEPEAKPAEAEKPKEEPKKKPALPPPAPPKKAEQAPEPKPEPKPPEIEPQKPQTPPKTLRENADLDAAMGQAPEPEKESPEKTELRVNQMLDDIFGKSFQKDMLPGGAADDLPDFEFDLVELNRGILHELEHTDDPMTAREIAKDHLVEDPLYYRKLEQIEKGMPRKVKDAFGNEVELGQIVHTRVVSGGVVEKVVTDIAFPGHDYSAPAQIGYSWDVRKNNRVVGRYHSEQDALNAANRKSLEVEEDKGVSDTLKAAGAWLARRWAALESRHGRRMALAIALSQLAPVPLLGTAVIAIAEATRGLRGYQDVKPTEAKGILIAPSIKSLNWKTKGHWVTMSPSGTHVYLGDSGKIEKGPAKIEGNKPENLSANPSKKEKIKVKLPAKKTPEQLKEIHKELAIKMPDLSEDQIDSLGDYTSGGFEEINRSLREGRPAKKGATVIPKIQKILEEAPVLKKPIEVYRGVNFPPEQAKKLLADLKAAEKNGKLMEEPAFMSTSINYEVASSFAGEASDPIVFAIDARKGLYMGETASSMKEMEFLMQKGSKFKVMGISEGKPHVVRLEQVI